MVIGTALHSAGGTALPAGGFFSASHVVFEAGMKKTAVLSALAMLLTLLTPPAFGREPKLNVKAICKSREADARMLRSTTGQSLEDCVRSEEAAKEQLSTVWASASAPIRNRCESDARSLGTTSYLDLLTCIQMEADMKSGSKKP